MCILNEGELPWFWWPCLDLFACLAWLDSRPLEGCCAPPEAWFWTPPAEPLGCPGMFGLTEDPRVEVYSKGKQEIDSIIYNKHVRLTMMIDSPLIEFQKNQSSPFLIRVKPAGPWFSMHLFFNNFAPANSWWTSFESTDNCW